MAFKKHIDIFLILGPPENRIYFILFYNISTARYATDKWFVHYLSHGTTGLRALLTLGLPWLNEG